MNSVITVCPKYGSEIPPTRQKEALEVAFLKPALARSRKYTAYCCAAPARPNVDPLRNDLRFQKLAASQEPKVNKVVGTETNIIELQCL